MPRLLKRRYALEFFSNCPNDCVLRALRRGQPDYVKPTSHKSVQQFIRYTVVGGFNTLFGYCVFAILNWSFSGWGPYSYMFAAILGSIITISVAFLGYKWFVFRTRGNYLIEWVRCFGVYGSSVLFGLVGMPILVPILRSHLHNPPLASYIAAAILTIGTVVFNFFGHRSFSFRQKPTESPNRGTHIS
jgi:putative flippase GtrA